MKKYSHESEELNALLGKKVEITLWYGKKIVGNLYRPNSMDYGCMFENGNEQWFSKTHVKKVKELK